MSVAEIEARISELLRELSDQEVETRYLRSEVANLERAAVLVAAPSAQRNNNASATPNVSNFTGGSNPMSPGGFESCYDPDAANNAQRMAMDLQAADSAKRNPNNYHGQGVHPFMPEEFLDTLSSKRETLIAAKAEYLRVREEKRRMEEVLERNKTAAEALNNDLERFYTRVKWRPGAGHSYACPITTDNENSRLKKQLLEVYDEAQTTQKQMLKQTEQIKVLAAQLEDMQHIDEEHFNAQTDLRLKKRELQAVEDEINSCKRILFHKEKYLGKVSDRSKDKERIKHIDADKRVAQTALVAHKDQARQAEAGIRHRALLITLLEERIEIIGEAIRGDASPLNSDASSSQHNNAVNNNNKGDGYSPSDVPRVDVQFVDRIRSDIARLQKQVAENNHVMDVADSQLEIGEERARIMERATSHASARLARSQKSHEAFNDVMAAELEEHRTEVVEKLNYYERINEELREELAQMEEAINAASADAAVSNTSFGAGRNSISGANGVRRASLGSTSMPLYNNGTPNPNNGAAADADEDSSAAMANDNGNTSSNYGGAEHDTSVVQDAFITIPSATARSGYNNTSTDGHEEPSAAAASGDALPAAVAAAERESTPERAESGEASTNKPSDDASVGGSDDLRIHHHTNNNTSSVGGSAAPTPIANTTNPSPTKEYRGNASATSLPPRDLEGLSTANHSYAASAAGKPLDADRQDHDDHHDDDVNAGSFNGDASTNELKASSVRPPLSSNEDGNASSGRKDLDDEDDADNGEDNVNDDVAPMPQETRDAMNSFTAFGN